MSSLGFVIGRAREEIVRDWRARLGNNQPPPALVEYAREWIDRIAALGEHVTPGEPLDHVFSSARTSIETLPAPPTEVPRVLASLSALRGSLIDAWNAHAARDDRGTHALHVAMDALIAAVSARHDTAAEDPLQRLAADRERTLGELESLLAASPVGIAFLDRNLRYLRINDALAAVNGRPAIEHIGRSVAEMLPDEAAVLEPLLRQVVETGQAALNLELSRVVPRDSGETRTYLVSFFPVHATSGDVIGVGGAISDVTNTRRAEQDLRRTQEQMQAILEHTPASIWIKDADGRIVLANRRLADALGQPHDAVVGRRSEDLLPPEAAAQHRAHDLVVAREGRSLEAEETVPGPQGVRTFLSIKFPLPGEPPMVGGIATEISDRKRMEDDLRLAVSARDGVLAAVSHDLRSPLHTIQVASATLLVQLASEHRLRRHLEIIHRSCLRMEHLISDLLDMASIGAGQLSVETRPEPADDIVREVTDLQQPLADEKKIVLLQQTGAGDVLVSCDRQRILQVFENLVGNALKFCRPGDTVVIGSTAEQGAVRFRVEDTGPGIPADLLPHLFDPYRSGSGSPRGVGLGLYIARGIVERHGGTIDVDAAPERGSRFSFTIPAASESAG